MGQDNVRQDKRRWDKKRVRQEKRRWDETRSDSERGGERRQGKTGEEGVRHNKVRQKERR